MFLVNALIATADADACAAVEPSIHFLKIEKDLSAVFPPAVALKSKLCVTPPEA